jgi:hypothetical protein
VPQVLNPNRLRAPTAKSIDYAVMERTKSAAVTLVSYGWGRKVGAAQLCASYNPVVCCRRWRVGDLNMAAKECIGLIAYRLMSKTDALFPGP